MLDYIIKGIIIGLSVSIPLGPIGILVIQKTLSKGKKSGFVTGLGAAFADFIYAILASLGISFIINSLVEHHIYFQIIGGVFLLYLGYSVFVTNTIKQFRNQNGSSNLIGDFLSTFFLTITNPMALLLFFGVFAGIGFLQEKFDYSSIIYIILGVNIGTVLWWYTLSTLINLFRSKIQLRRLNWINKISGLVIFIFGLVAIFSIIFY